VRSSGIDATRQGIVGNILNAQRVNRARNASSGNQENQFVQQLKRLLEESKPKVKPSPEAENPAIGDRERSGGRFLMNRRKQGDQEERGEEEEHRVDITV